jgi:tetratricopeptide (TPR) repeat protein
MRERTSYSLGDLDLDLVRRIDAVCRRFEADLRAGQSPVIADYLGDIPEVGRSALRSELIGLEQELRRSDQTSACPDSGPIADAPSLEPASPPTAPIPGLGNPFVHEEATVAARDQATVDLGSCTPAPADASGPARVRYFGDYEIERELARGGMGVVFRARQISLNRTVALKMILAGQLADDTDVKRFYTEAEAAANLDHPGIVPIYEVGQHEGQHYFSMGFVEGQSLAQQLADGPLPPREAAALMVKAAEAIAYAHSRGVIHRDLKPGNILLDRDGHPRVTDFGLAKKLQSESGLTGSGQIMGTPSYMPPEQAGGNRGDVGPAADVYALGATLYALVTGRPPFQAATAMDTVIQVIGEEPVPPRRLNPTVPRDLETIGLKCLQKEPARRYATAAELAEDLRRFEAGETIRARPVGRPERLWRWCRREPALAALALTLVAGLLGVATQWFRAESHLKEALHQRGRAESNLTYALRQSSRAEANARKEVAARRRAQGRFDAAMNALRDVEGISKDAALLREPRLEELRAKLLQTALDFYKEFQSFLEEDASPGARSQLSEAYARVAQITWELGRQDEALATHRRALALVEQMAAAAPADAGVRFALARCHTRIGFALRTMARPAEALRAYEQAREIQESLARDHPETARYREVLSWTLSSLGVIELEFGRAAEAIGLHRQAIAIHEDLVGRDPGNATYRNDLGWCWRYLSQALGASGERDAALRMARQAVALYEELVRADRGAAELRWRWARCLDEVGRICSLSGRPAEGARPLERAVELHEGLARDNPVFYGVDVIRSRLYAAYQRVLSGRPEEAVACIRRVEDVLNRTPQVRPALLLHDLACSHILWSAAGREGAIGPAEREARTQRAIEVLRRAVVVGHVDLDQVRRDPLLDPLRPRRDFQEMIMDLSFPVNAFQD